MKSLFPAAGILGYQVGDQLHPPMVDDEALWADGRRWKEAALRHTLEAAELLGVERGARVLDIGCGVGGPARTLVDEYDASVYGVTISARMLAIALAINAGQQTWRESIVCEQHDAQEPYERDGFTAGWSLNMLYQVPDKRALLACAHAALVPGARLLLEDWMLTDHGTADTVATMTEHFEHEHVWELRDVPMALEDTGFALVTQQDLSEVGRTHMARHFTEQFDRWIRPQIEADFPGTPRSGRQMCDEWVAAVEATIDLYQREELAYARIVARRR